MSKRMLVAAFAAAGVMAVHGGAVAQDTQTTTTTTTTVTTNQGTTDWTTMGRTLTYHLRREQNPVGGGDQVALMHMYHNNVYEIELARLALAKSSNHGVWKFAEMLLNDHMAMNDELRRTFPSGPWQGWNAPGMNNWNSANTMGMNTRNENRAGGDTGTAAGGAGSDMQGDMSGNRVNWSSDWQNADEAMRWLSGDEMRMLTDLRRFSGYGFDREWLGLQTRLHAKALEMLNETASRTSNSNVRSFIDNRDDAIAEHLRQARGMLFMYSDPFHVQRNWPWWH